MATVTDNTWVVDPADGGPKLLLAGDDVPAWAKDQVGSHLVEGGDDAEPTPYAEQSFADLKAELARRNEGRADEDKVNPEGRASIASYAAALDADDAKQAAASGSTGAGDPDGDPSPGSGS